MMPERQSAGDTLLEPFDSSKLFPDARRRSFWSKLLMVLIAPILLVLYIVILMIFIAIYSVGMITCIFPYIEKAQTDADMKAQNRKDVNAKNPDFIEIPVPGTVNVASQGQEYVISARVGSPSKHNGSPPIIFPNGLMATVFTFIGLQDMFTQAGYFTVVFDRFGVGMSDGFPDTSDEHTKAASAFDVANEMNFVMDYIADNNKYGFDRDTKWIASGFSMGSIVTQSFMAIHPNRLCGYHNSDGLPHCMGVTNGATFNKAGGTWNLFTSLHWTGIPRLMMSGLKKMIEDVFYAPQFSTEFMLSFWTSKKSFQATKLENMTMMSCCDLVNAAWGPLSAPAMLKSDPHMFYQLCRYPPKEAVEVNEKRSVNLPRRSIPLSTKESRSQNEIGPDWLTSEECKQVEDHFRSLAGNVKSPEDIIGDLKSTYFPEHEPHIHPVDRPSMRVGGINTDTVVHPLSPQMQNIAFRAYGSRMFIMDGTLLESSLGEDSYSQMSRNMQAYEQSLQAILSIDGGRYIYPKMDHGNSLHRGESMRQLSEICAGCRQTTASNKV